MSHGANVEKSEYEVAYDAAVKKHDELSKIFAGIKAKVDSSLNTVPFPDPAICFEIPPLDQELKKLLAPKRENGGFNPLSYLKNTCSTLHTSLSKTPLGGGELILSYLVPTLFVFMIVFTILAALFAYPAYAFFIGLVVVTVGVAAKRKMEKREETAWRAAALQSISQKGILFVQPIGIEWIAAVRKLGENVDIGLKKCEWDGIQRGDAMLAIYVGRDSKCIGVVSSQGKFYYPGQPGYPVNISVPERITQLFRKLQGDCQLCQEFYETLVEVQQTAETANALGAVIDAWKTVFIPPQTKNRIHGMLTLFLMGDKAAPRGLLLYGPPGTGKTIIAKAISDSCGAKFYPTSLPDFKMGHIGESAQKVKSFWQEVRKEPQAVIFIDECEGVFGARGSADSDSFSAEIVQSFLAEWDGMQTKGKAPTVWVIGATNRRDLIDAAILSRFGEEIEIPLPDAVLRRKILEEELRSIDMTTDWLPEETGKMTQGMTGRDLNRLASALRVAPANDNATDVLKTAITTMRGRGSTKTNEDARWDSLVLADKTMKDLKTACGMLQHADELTKQGVSIPRGIIFYGPPGTGKTQIARTLANESGLSFVAVSTGDLKASYLGQSANKVKMVFEKVRSQSPAILFIDEIDIVCPSRDGNNDPLTGEIVGQLLQELDGVKTDPAHIFVVAASNRLDSIDSAILSRFPKQIEIPLPDRLSRERLIKIMLSKAKHSLESSQIESLADQTEGMSGRDLRSMVENAQHLAVARALEAGDAKNVMITPEDFNRE